MIMEIIEEKGYFLDGPDYWGNRQIENEIDYLKKEQIISSLKDEEIKFINEDYFYIKKGNPDKIIVKDGQLVKNG
jgi:hypothetical protein